jgi:hypothetical protein
MQIASYNLDVITLRFNPPLDVFVTVEPYKLQDWYMAGCYECDTFGTWSSSEEEAVKDLMETLLSEYREISQTPAEHLAEANTKFKAWMLAHMTIEPP